VQVGSHRGAVARRVSRSCSAVIPEEAARWPSRAECPFWPRPPSEDTGATPSPFGPVRERDHGLARSGSRHGWICDPKPWSRRIDSRRMNAVLAV
jgi:hypothetical protein